MTQSVAGREPRPNDPNQPPFEKAYRAYLKVDLPVPPAKAAEIAESIRIALDNSAETDKPLDILANDDPQLAEYFFANAFDDETLPDALTQAVKNSDRFINAERILDARITEEQNRPRPNQDLLAALRQRSWLERQVAFFELISSFPEQPPSLTFLPGQTESPDAS